MSEFDYARAQFFARETARLTALGVQGVFGEQTHRLEQTINALYSLPQGVGDGPHIMGLFPSRIQAENWFNSSGTLGHSTSEYAVLSINPAKGTVELSAPKRWSKPQ